MKQIFFRYTGIAVLLGASVVSFERRCVAADAPSTPSPLSLSETLSGQTKIDYETAKHLFEDGDFSGAASKFRQAYDRVKDPRLLWNLLVCEKAMRHYARVQKLAARYLEEGKDTLSAEQKRAGAELLETLQTVIGSLSVQAEPGTEIAIDGEPLGVTPLQTIHLDLGKHKLVAEKAGFKPFTSAFEIVGGEQTVVKVAQLVLNPKASLVVQAATGDVIFFDGKQVAATRWQADVEVGAHSLRVTAPAHKPYELRLDLAEGTRRTVQVTLAKESGPLWPWIVGGVVVASAAAVGGYFLFKPDEKPAEQPSGSLAPGTVVGSFWR